MVNKTSRFQLNRYSKNEDWVAPSEDGTGTADPPGHNDLANHADEYSVDKGPVADRPATGNYSDELYFATDSDERTLYRWNETAAAWAAEFVSPPNINASDLGFDLTTQAELDTHENTSDAHHTRPSAGDGLDDASNVFSVNETAVDHDTLQNYVANEHVDHSGVSIVAGAGLIGGGDLTTSRTLDAHNVTEQSSAYTASENDVVLANATGGDVPVTLPAASTDVAVTVKKVDGSANNVSLQTPGAETIDGQAQLNITNQWTARSIVANATDYFNI